METLALAMEEARAKEGWDVEPLLGIVLRVTPPPPDGEMYAVLPFPVQPAQIYPNTGEALLYIGSQMNQPDAPKALTPRERRNFAGVLFAAEGWQAPSERARDTAEGRERRRLADIPGSKEIRFIHLLDCSGRYCTVTRIRGEEPKLITIEPDMDPGNMRMEGRVVVALREFLLGVGRNLRPDAMDRDAIAAIAREDEP